MQRSRTLGLINIKISLLEVYKKKVGFKNKKQTLIFEFLKTPDAQWQEKVQAAQMSQSGHCILILLEGA